MSQKELLNLRQMACIFVVIGGGTCSWCCKSGLENFDGNISIFYPSSVQYEGEFIFFVYNLFNDDVNPLGYLLSSGIA